MIDIQQLTSLISAFRVETEKESILPRIRLVAGLWHGPRKPRAEGELAHTSAEAQPGLRSRTPRGNSGDLGRAKSSRASRTQSQTGLNSAETQPRTAFRKRQRRRWFSRKYYASVMNLKEFLESNIGDEFCGIISSALSKDFRQNH